MPAIEFTPSSIFLETSLSTISGDAPGYSVRTTTTGKLMFGNWLEYRDMAAFEACNKIWEKFGQEQAEKYSNYSDQFDELKINAYRGQVFEDWS